MWRKLSRLALLLNLILVPDLGLSATSSWVQALKVDLRSDPKMSGTSIAQLNRGDEVTVVGTQGLWMQVTIHGKTGWISKIFLSDHPPIGNAELSKEVKFSMEKTTRRRSSSYAVSASTRGLQADRSISRRNQEDGKSDYQSLEKMEKLNIDSAQISRFSEEAREANL